MHPCMSSKFPSEIWARPTGLSAHEFACFWRQMVVRADKKNETTKPISNLLLYKKRGEKYNHAIL